ncbi:hypothetical protein [Streptomyces anulatus]|uniref:hypothetical protein n=1 Tax=Streptomyces anulatus TaxID=1892 RepID=UPI00386E61A9|nr:hypothetical protein OG238_01075 [Streptomyces anulatus]
MFVFMCAGCGAELTTPLSQVSLPVHTRQQYGNGTQLPVLMESGTFAVDPDPWGGPWRTWDEIDPGEAEARGIYAPVHALSDSTTGASVIAPGDIRGTRLIPEKRGDACCGLDGADGPNMACEACDLPVATRIDDCSLWQAVRLSSDAVHRVPVGSAHTTPLSWAELAAKGEKAPPFGPIATWGGRLGSNHYWSWSPQWEAAAGHALAQRLAASEGPAAAGRRACVGTRPRPDHPGPSPAALGRQPAGLGMNRYEEDVDARVRAGLSRSSQTAAASAYLVPLPLEVWLWLVSPQPYLPVPASGRIPQDVLRDDPLPLLPHYLFRADRGTLQHTLVRLPAVRRPWLRTILDTLTEGTSADLF